MPASAVVRYRASKVEPVAGAAAAALSVVPRIRMSAFFHLPVLITTGVSTGVGVAEPDGADAALVRVPSVAVTVNV